MLLPLMLLLQVLRMKARRMHAGRGAVWAQSMSCALYRCKSLHRCLGRDEATLFVDR